MKIVHVVYSLEMGGAEVLVGQLSRTQRAGGHEVSICAYSQLGVVGEKLRDEGFDIQVLGEAPPLKTMWRYFKIFLKQKPDVVHCHNAAPTTHAAMSARLAGVRKVISTRHRLELPYKNAEEIRYSLMGMFCDWVTGICETTCKDLRGAPLARLKKIIRVYNGTVPVERASFEALGKTGFTIIFIGRIAPVKDLGTLVRAVMIAKESVPGLRFWVVGDGWVRHELEAVIEELGAHEWVKLWGLQMDTAPFFSAADAFVMSSLSEGLPMSLLQSMSLGTPAILTDVDGSGEVLRLTGGGILVPVSAPEKFAEAIVTMANDAELRAEFGRRARAAYEQHFTLERMSDGYMRLYEGGGAPAAHPVPAHGKAQ
jgi:glycosyltransferase involved in cell wall biosynthesis